MWSIKAFWLNSVYFSQHDDVHVDIETLQFERERAGSAAHTATLLWTEQEWADFLYFLDHYSAVIPTDVIKLISNIRKDLKKKKKEVITKESRMKDKTVMKGLNEPFCKRQKVCISNKNSERRIRRLGFLIGRPLNACKWFKPNQKEKKKIFLCLRINWCSVTIASLPSGCIWNHYQIKPGYKLP